MRQTPTDELGAEIEVEDEVRNKIDDILSGSKTTTENELNEIRYWLHFVAGKWEEEQIRRKECEDIVNNIKNESYGLRKAVEALNSTGVEKAELQSQLASTKSLVQMQKDLSKKSEEYESLKFEFLLCQKELEKREDLAKSLETNLIETKVDLVKSKEISSMYRLVAGEYGSRLEKHRTEKYGQLLVDLDDIRLLTNFCQQLRPRINETKEKKSAVAKFFSKLKKKHKRSSGSPELDDDDVSIMSSKANTALSNDQSVKGSEE